VTVSRKEIRERNERCDFVWWNVLHISGTCFDIVVMCHIAV